MGTAQDMLDLLGGDPAKLAELEVAGGRRTWGSSRALTSVGQVYPRSLDYDVASALVQLAAGPSSLATTIRLMAGLELATEGFRPGQVGSSAMPHKMNTRSSERVNGLTVLLRGYAGMAGELAGAQWNEGDVFCSVVRRVALPDAFFAIDGLVETLLTVLDEFGAYPAVIETELDAVPAVPRHHRGTHGRGPRGSRAGDRTRGDQGARGGRRTGDAGEGPGGQRPAGPPGG
jgi:adenylosuccinate lyase